MANSAARRIEYTETESITEVTARFMLRQVKKRWLSLEKMLIRIIEQWPNLRHFFLVTVVEDKQFKSTISKSEQYQRIVKVLKNEEKTLAYSTFAVYVASIFSKFVVPLQTSTPMIHNLYSMCQDLVTSLCQMFLLDDKYSKVNKNGTRVQSFHGVKKA